VTAQAGFGGGGPGSAVAIGGGVGVGRRWGGGQEEMGESTRGFRFTILAAFVLPFFSKKIRPV